VGKTVDAKRIALKLCWVKWSIVATPKRVHFPPVEERFR
jgi:hypothetical protein